MNTLILNSYAKLNLYLEVLNKRKDSYHNIKTLFEKIDLHDKVILKTRRGKKINLTCSLPDLSVDETNLVYRSAKLLQDSYNINKGVDIKLVKRIPVGAGLGGGSSNAACLLTALNKLWRLNLTKNELAGLAKKIGCDVPFFIYDTAFALGRARGDIIEPLRALNNIRLWHILVVPKIKVSTPLIYKKWDSLDSHKSASLTALDRRGRLNNKHLTRLAPHLRVYSKNNKKNKFTKCAGLTRPKYGVNILDLALRRNNRSLISEGLFNNLEQVTANLYPQIRSIKEKLFQMGVKSILMSGSGPAVFGIVSSRKEAEHLGRQLKETNSLWQVYVTKTKK